MADEATPAATTETAPATTETAPVAAVEAKEPLKAPMPKGALERMKEALDKGKDAPKAEGEKPAEEAKDKPAEEKKDEAVKEPRLSRALAIVVEREQKVIAREKAIKEAETTHKATIAAESADLTLVREAKAALAKGGQLAALRVLIPGLDHRALVALGEQMTRDVEPTAEDVARRVAAEEWETRQKAAAADAEKEAQGKRDRESAQEQVRATEYCQKASEICGGIENTKWPRVVIAQVTGPQFWEAAQSLETQLGRRVQQVEVLDAIEKILKTREDSAREVEAKRAAPPPVKQPEAPKAKAVPAQQQSRQVTGRKPSPLNRAEAALKRLNIS
jgi:hypothetical protein